MKRIISLALCFLLAFTLCQPAFAAHITWTGVAGDKSWHTAGNWNPEQEPMDGDYVIIPESSVVEYVYGETSVRLNCAGNLTVSGGTLKITNPSPYENSSLINGKLDGEGDITITEGSNLSWNGGSIEGSGSLILENNANLYAIPSSLDRYLVNNGALLISGGSLRLTGGAEGSGNFSIQENKTLELGGNESYNLSSNVVNMGTLKISDSCTSVNFNSGYTQQNTGTLEFDIGGTSEFTTLEVTGTAILNGKLKINILDGYSPIPGDTFEIMTCGSRTGVFASISSNTDGITFEPTYTDTGLTLTVSEAATVWEVANATDLETALNGFQSGDTIKLTADFTYNKGIIIDGKNITFDTNSFKLTVYNSTDPSPGVGLEVKNGGNVFLIGSGQFNVRQISDGTCYGVKVSDASTAMVTNIQVTLLDDGSAFGAYADGTGSSIHVLGNVHVTGEGGCGARTLGRGRITVDGTITAMAYINIGYTNKDKSSGVDDPEKPGYLKYCTEPVTGIVWVKASPVVVPTVPQNFIATPGDGQVALSWEAPDSDGGAVITHYEVSADDGTTWIEASTSTSHTFTGLTNGLEYTFKVRAVNSEGTGAEASATATPVAPATPVPTQPGQLYTWGNNVHGQLGDGTLQSKSIPTHIGTAEDWTAVSAGDLHTVALKSDGSLWAWGDNHDGRLGDGTTELRKDSPVQIGSDNDWAAVEAGDNHTVALKTDGSLWAWGGNSIGQLGDGSLENRNLPTLIDDGSTWIAVSAGSYHTVALKADGSLWAWGDNSKGQLGDGSTTFKKVPTQISTEEWAAVSAGTKFTVALKADGSLWTWGWNNVGQLGDGTVVDKNVPTRVGSDTWLAAAAGDNHVVAIKEDGSLWAWGGNEYGELGNGSSDGVSDPPAHPVPAQIGTDTDWIFVSTSYAHNAAFKTDGSLWLWGLNGSGQMGDGTSGTAKTVPQRLDGAGTWLAVACGGSHTVATLEAEPTVPEFAGGNGSEEEPYLIETVDHLNNVRNYLGTENNDKHYKLNANLNLDVAPYNSGAGWEPIGTLESPFTGSFDGGGHTISNLFFNSISDSNIGLFGCTGETAKIRNLGLVDVNITGYSEIGGLVGRNYGQITNSYVTGDVTGRDEVGGLVGRNYGNITESYTVGRVESLWNAGGLVGLNSGGNISKSYATGSVTGIETGINYTYVGGLVGTNNGSISDSYARGAVSGQEDIGGLVGNNYIDGTITNSYSTGAVSGDSYIGGLVGYNYTEGNVTNSYWDMETSHQTDSDGGTGKNTANMKQQETYVGWDFVATWAINASENDGYPFLVASTVPTAPTEPQNFTATPGDGEVTLSWTAPLNDGGAEITHYEVSSDNGATWVTASTSNSHTFTGLTNGTTYTFKVRAVNSAGNGAEASATATPIAPAQTTHTVNFYSNGSLYTSKTVTSGSTLGSNWPDSPTRSGYSFGGWFTGQNGAGTQYTSTTIITADVDLYAKWTYNGGSGGGGGGGSSTPTTPASPVYKAIVKAESSTEKTLLIRVNRDTGTAFLGEDPWHERPKGRTVINMPSIPGVGSYSVGIPVPDLSTSDVQGTVTINTGSGSITVPSNMLTGVADADGNKAQISIGQGDKSTLPKNIKSAIGDRPLVQLTLSIDGKMIGWSNPNAPVTVSIPYTPTSAELANPENIVVWYIDTSGNIVTIPNGHFDPATGMVTFYTTHFSNYAVAYNKVSFNDVTADAWYHKAVSFIAARAITSGTGGGNFSPEAKLTRGQFIVMLMKAYGIAPDANPKDNFADAGATYYTGYLAAAKRFGISSGIGNNMFAPDKEITRQEMFTLLCNALKTIGRLPEGAAGKPLSAFADAGSIAPWAREAMALLIETGTIGGDNGQLNPTEITTRAEMAQVLYNLLSK